MALDPGATVCHPGSRLQPRASAVPAQIPQSEKPFVVFEGSHHFFSPYPTRTQTARVKLASRNVESCTKLGNPTRAEDPLHYGPFRAVPPTVRTRSKCVLTVWRFLKKLEIELPYDPAIPLLGIHSRETRSERDTCTPMFIAALFIIARTWEQPRCPSADEWIRKLWYIYTMDYYSAIKKEFI